MKTLLFSLLFATNVTVVSCAQKEHQQPMPMYIITAPDTNPYLYTTHNQYGIQPPQYCTANEPGWEFYDDIMNMTYNDSQSAIMNEITLTPVYKPAQITITQQEQKSLLKTNSLLPDDNTMQSLYTTASHITCNAYRGKTSQGHENEQLVQMIQDMNNAKNCGISEDCMTEFAYKQKNNMNINDTCISPLVPIIFILLKQYNATVQETGEQLPSYFNSKKPSLAEMLNAPTKTNAISNKRNVISEYPAFFQFIYNINNATQELSIDAVKIFMKYLYKDNNILLEDYSDGSYKDFKHDFYDKSCDVLGRNLIDLPIDKDNNLHNLLQMIDKAKEVEDITNEDDLINHMAAFKVTQSLGAQLLTMLSTSYTDNTRKRIVLLCKLIKKYNHERGFKINPTANQYHAYCIKEALNVSLPESLDNQRLLNGESYAFVEFAELREAYKIVKKASEEEIASLF